MGEAQAKDRRKRAPNFTREETRLLIKLTCEFTNILENKRTDSTTTADKNNAWQKVGERFNACSGRLRFTCGK